MLRTNLNPCRKTDLLFFYFPSRKEPSPLGLCVLLAAVAASSCAGPPVTGPCQESFLWNLSRMETRWISSSQEPLTLPQSQLSGSDPWVPPCGRCPHCMVLRWSQVRHILELPPEDPAVHPGAGQGRCQLLASFPAQCPAQLSCCWCPQESPPHCSPLLPQSPVARAPVSGSGQRPASCTLLPVGGMAVAPVPPTVCVARSPESRSGLVTAVHTR